jgi:hypothetical protein
VQKKDAITWSCIATNPAGKSQKDFLLNVQFKPTIDESKSSPSIINALQTEDIKLNCIVEAEPKAEVF